MGRSELDVINGDPSGSDDGVSGLSQIEPASPAPLATFVGTNPFLKQLRPVLPELETQRILHNRGVSKSGEEQEMTSEGKIAALASLTTTYRATLGGARFAQRVAGQVLTSLTLRDPRDPRYLRFYYSQAEVMRGGKIVAMPDFLQSLTGSGFVLAGPSGVGKTAFVQRLRVLLGERHTIIRGEGDLPAEYVLLPMLVVQWPDCGTLQGFFANLRNALIGELGSAQTSEVAFANLRGPNAANIAIAICIFANLGLLVVDGMCSQSRFGECREILDFISTFKGRSGIPTIVSCTYPALQLIGRGGSKHSFFGSAGYEYWDLEPPGFEWDRTCQSVWKLGFHASDSGMPEFLPKLMWDSSLGAMRFFITAFTAVHLRAVYEPGFFEHAATSDVVELLSLSLRQFKEPLSVMKRFQDTGKVELEDMVHADYLPFNVFSRTPSGMFERELKSMRLPAPPKGKK